MRNSFIIIITLFSSVLTGCKNPIEPHPINFTRLSFIGNTPLTFVLSPEYAPYDGYFETSVSMHIDSSESRSESDASFFNHLGNPYLLEQPFSIVADNNMLFDTSKESQYDLTYRNYDSLDFSHPVIWHVEGGKYAQSFADTLLPPEKVEILFPVPNKQNILPSKPFTLKYNVVGVDSVFILLMIFNTDTTFNYFSERNYHIANTGTFEINEKVISFPPFAVSIHISIAAVTQKTHQVSGQNYLIRAGIIDNAGVKLTD